MCLFRECFLVEVGLDIAPYKIAASCPFKDSFATMLDEEAIKTLAIIRDRTKRCKKLFFCNGANKFMHHVVKIVSWCCRDRVINVLLDSDADGRTNVSTALVIDTSLKIR